MSKQTRAKVTKVPPAPPEPYYKIEAHLDQEEACRMKNWLRLVKNNHFYYSPLKQGLRDLLDELERQGL